ncbi:hypothetical protein CROQUDRAFT_659554 [Cronartium quercuum f. sp. fusiforme G11]|uniref:Thaumatin-like protein n=1 Tax=Cronartium quercuum f. sp. fusiforme G11 TaxID=708437 RepID=A0A9P6TAL3_9BASI|nr:hypothetical protein CROQUDRAFT_659554 [Cronartium quercuum f. sp. fusiforme G11]
MLNKTKISIIYVGILSWSYFTSLVHSRTFTIRNNCPFTIWPAYFTNPDSPAQIDRNASPAGWEAPGGNQRTINVPDGWAGRFWGRRNCNFGSGSSLPSTCAIGGCNGGLVCDANSGTGVPPVTLAEFKLNGAGNTDFYDVSNVDGSDLPVRISNTKNCPVPTCGVDLNPNCPDDRLKIRDSNGVTIGCLSACQANLDGNSGNSANCCTGSHSTAATCPSSGVQYYNYFKTNCPNAYAYAYDEGSESSLWTCSANGGGSDYTVTFCP